MRSDTVTQPTPAMRAAMAAAEVGDDVFGDDPTVNALQQYVADLLGKDAGLFVPSGTMANLLACMTHCSTRSSEMILGDESHIHFYEGGNTAQFGGIHSRTIKNESDGRMDLNAIEKAIRPHGDVHLPTTQLIILEQTHNRTGGRILPVEYIDQASEIAKRHGLKLHVDGARLLNATVALGVTPARMVASVDSISLCLSKGLGAPIGSILVGSNEFIQRARRLRKALGGGMRQVGIIAAAGLLAVKEMVHGLALDHQHAREIATALSSTPGFIVPSLETVETNILYVKLDTSLLNLNAQELCLKLREEGLLIIPTDVETIRFVTHHMITKEMIQQAIQIVKKVAAENSKQ